VNLAYRWSNYEERGAHDEFTLAAIAQNLRRMAQLVTQMSATQACPSTTRLHKGEKPADLSCSRPVKIAKALGLSIPLRLLAGADEVIEPDKAGRSACDRNGVSVLGTP
jgi:hypothetical protein